jgi:hypothetical protein
VVIEASSPDEPERAESGEPVLRGPVLDVLRTLLGDHQERDTVLSIVGELVARNTDLERRFARMAARYKPSEKVSTAQLVLFLDAIKRSLGEPARKARQPTVTPRSWPQTTNCGRPPESTTTRMMTSASCARRLRHGSRVPRRRPHTCGESTIRSPCLQSSARALGAVAIASAPSRTSPK